MFYSTLVHHTQRLQHFSVLFVCFFPSPTLWGPFDQFPGGFSQIFSSILHGGGFPFFFFSFFAFSPFFWCDLSSLHCHQWNRSKCDGSHDTTFSSGCFRTSPVLPHTKKKKKYPTKTWQSDLMDFVFSLSSLPSCANQQRHLALTVTWQPSALC